MPDFVQRSFAGGEIAEAVYGRADQVKYQTGLATCRNFLVRRYGGVDNRPGSELIVEMKDSSQPHRLFRFAFNADQTYVLLFGNQYMRVVRQGVQLQVSGVAAWSNATAYVLRDLVVQGGVYYYCLAANTNHPPPNATYWYALTGTVYEIPTPYVTADLQSLYIEQSGDVISIDHPSYFPRELRRYGHTSWELDLASFGPGQDQPTNVTVVRGANGSKTFRYKVTSIATETFEESETGLGPTRAISGITNANPAVVTATSHQFANGDEVYLSGIVGMTDLNGQAYTIAGVTLHTFQLVGVNSTTFGTYASGGVAQGTQATTDARKVPNGTAMSGATQANPCQVTSAGHGLTTGDSVIISGVVGMVQLNGWAGTVTVLDGSNVTIDGVDATGYAAYVSGGTIQCTNWLLADDPTDANPHVISWTAVADSQAYNVYKAQNGVYGFIGTADGISFNDNNITPDMKNTPPISRNPFNGAGNYPSVVGYYDQRRWHCNTTNKPETAFGSRSGKFSNFTISYPQQDDDAVTYPLAGRQVNAIRHLVDIGTMVILTSGGEWVALGDSNGVLTPSTPGLKQVGYNGASPVPPVIVGNNMLFVQARGNLVRDFRTTITSTGSTGFAGDDLTVFSPHLFEGYTLMHWAYAQIPHSTVYAVRSDGVLLGLTYLKQHEVVGWHRHDTDGRYEDVTVVSEGDEDLVYVLVNRTIQGVTRRYLERFPSRRVSDVEVDACFLDSYLTYDGRNTGATTMTLTSITGVWSYPTLLTLTASAGFFTAPMVGDAIVLKTADDVWLTCHIAAYVSPTVASVRATLDVPVSFQRYTTASWMRGVDQVAGLDHLEGKSVAILGDGNVVANGVDAPFYTVVGGQLSPALLRPYGVIHVGLPYVSELETLDIEVLGGESIEAKQKQLTSLTIQVQASRSVLVGPSSDTLYERRPDLPAAGRAQPVETRKWEMGMAATWNNSGRIFMRNRDPLPLSVLSIYPHGELGG